MNFYSKPIKKKYEELTIADDFMFYKVMTDKDLCKGLLETILGIEIRDLVYHQTQETMKDSYDGKGVRLDIYAADEASTVYNIEMQATYDEDLPKRSRYYQSCIDMDLLNKGVRFKKLNKSIVIFICTFDLFKKGLPIYTFNTRCVEDNELVLGDEVTKIFVNTTADISKTDTKLGSLIRYIDKGIVSDEYTRTLDNAVVSSRKSKEWRVKFMKYEADKQDWLDEGIKQGIEQGIEQGKLKSLIKTTINMYRKGKSVEEISDLIDVDVQFVEKICSIASEIQDDTNVDEIYNMYINEIQNV